MVCLGLEPGLVFAEAETNPLSHGGAAKFVKVPPRSHCKLVLDEKAYLGTSELLMTSDS